MTHLSERRKRCTADALSWRLRSHEFRVLSLQCLQLIEKAIVLGVGDTGLIEHVVTVVVGVDFAAQFGDALGSFLGGRHRMEPLLGLC